MKRFLGILMLVSMSVKASCIVYYQDTPVTQPLADPLYHLLTQANECPNSPSALTRLLTEQSFKQHVFMVANRGRHNPSEGSFSFFVAIDGQSAGPSDFFIGYFTDAVQGQLQLDERARPNKLLVENIVWDSEKQLYNFYELKSNPDNEVHWYYRGDSRDAYLDNTRLYRFEAKEPAHFGERMRCSACHNSGGPIMKESAYPNNDWWNKDRTLPLTPNVPDSAVQALMASLENPMHLSHRVETGMMRLFDSPRLREFKNALTLPEQLRPLFCTVEINLESAQNDDSPFAIPSAFWLDPTLNVPLHSSLTESDYQQLLEAFDMRFPETNLRDADHRWLTPVKGKDDLLAIEDLLKQGIVSKAFVEAVLMIDYKHPVFSKPRCQLLTLLPEQASGDWLAQFRQNLLAQGGKYALLLVKYLDNQRPSRYEQILQKYQASIQQLLETDTDREKVFTRLLTQREAVSRAEISKNPMGEILEPGFRVIFPHRGENH